MKRTSQYHPRWQSLLLAAIAPIILLGASATSFAQSTVNQNHFALASLFSSTAKQNFLDPFALTNFHANAFSATSPTPAFAFPKPDFSALEQWYEIVKYEYADPATDNALYFWVKQKTKDVPPGTFCMQFLDKDGVMVDPWDTRWGTGIHIERSEVGQVTKANVSTPFEKAMERVVSVKVYRPKG